MLLMAASEPIEREEEDEVNTKPRTYKTPEQIVAFIMARVDRRNGPDDYCWIYQGNVNKLTGYGQATLNFKVDTVHRLMYTHVIEPIAPKMQIDHLCRVRACCNPVHLEMVTQQENIRRGESLSARYARRTHCSKGHEFSEENTMRISTNPSYRICRTCKRSVDAARRAKLSGEVQ